MNDAQRFAALRKQMRNVAPQTEIEATRWHPMDYIHVRIVRALQNADATTLDDVVNVLKSDALPPNFGVKCWLACYDTLKAIGKID